MSSMFSSKGRYALRVMVDIAAHPGWTSLGDIAQRQNISRKYLEQVIALMRKAGFVESQRGKAGGYRLVGEPSDYTLSQILIAAEGKNSMSACSDCASGENVASTAAGSAGLTSSSALTSTPPSSRRAKDTNQTNQLASSASLNAFSEVSPASTLMSDSEHIGCDGNCDLAMVWHHMDAITGSYLSTTTLADVALAGDKK